MPDDVLTAPLEVMLFDRAFLWRFRAKPLRVIDGDTAVVLADTGYFGRHEVHVRIAGLNAPELGQPGADEARRALDAAVFDRGGVALDWPLRLISLQRETVVSEVRSFERFVSTIFVVRGNVMIDVRELIAGSAT